MTTDADRVDTEHPTTGEQAPPLGQPTPVPRTGWRHKIRSQPALYQTYRALIFVVGLLCIAGGFALSVLPGPLTIPPVLLGLWVWSTEFRWAQRLFQRVAVKARQAWQHTKLHPVVSTLTIVAGLAVVVLGVWALRHFHVVATVRDAVGI